MGFGPLLKQLGVHYKSKINSLLYTVDVSIFVGIFVREVEGNKKDLIHQSNIEPMSGHKKFVNQILSKITENLNPIVNFSSNSINPPINLILPLSGRYKVFKRFLNMYEDACLKEAEFSKLYVILFRNERTPKEFEMTVRLINQFNSKYYDSIKVLQSNETFSRGRALQLGVDHLQDHDLMLFIDVDMIFSRTAIGRVRRNMANGSIYFPIVYSLYNSKLSNKSMVNEFLYNIQDCIDENNGFWRQFGFGIVSLYKKDYLALGGLNLQIAGWGYEDVTFFDNVIRSKLKIIRSPDPDFIHVYHSVECDEGLDSEQKSMCLGTKASTLGSLEFLQKLFIKYRSLFR